MKRFLRGVDPVVLLICMIAYGLVILIVYKQLGSMVRFPNYEKVYIVLGAIVATIITSLLARFLEVLKLKKIRKHKLAANYVSDFKYYEIH